MLLFPLFQRDLHLTILTINVTVAKNFNKTLEALFEWMKMYFRLPMKLSSNQESVRCILFLNSTYESQCYSKNW